MSKLKSIFNRIFKKKPVDKIELNFDGERGERLLTKDEEAIIYGFTKSPDWRVVQKIINNEIKNLYVVGMTAPDTMEEYLGYRFMIGEHRKFKATIRKIAQRVEIKKKEQESERKKNNKNSGG